VFLMFWSLRTALLYKTDSVSFSPTIRLGEGVKRRLNVKAPGISEGV